MRCDGKDLASLHISNKAEATLGAKALNSALHDDTAFLTWAVCRSHGSFHDGLGLRLAASRRPRWVTPASSSVVQRHASWAPEHGRVSRVNCRSIASRIALARLLDSALAGCSSGGPAFSLSTCGAGPPWPAMRGLSACAPRAPCRDRRDQEAKPDQAGFSRSQPCVRSVFLSQHLRVRHVRRIGGGEPCTLRLYRCGRRQGMIGKMV